MDKLKNLSWIYLPIVLSIMLGGVVLAYAIDWSNQDFFVTDRNGNQIHWITGTGITVWNVTVANNEVVFAPTEFNEFRHHEFFSNRGFDVTLDFLNASRADYTLFSGGGGSNARNTELHLNGTILDGAEINGVSALLLFTFDDVNCVINPPTGNILDCDGTNIIDIGSVSGGLDLTLFFNQTRNVPPFVLETAQNISAERSGNAIIVRWEVPLQGNPEKYIIQRSDNFEPFVDRFETDRQDDNKIINKITKRQLYWKLDDTVSIGNYSYRIVSTQQNQQVFAQPTETIEIKQFFERTVSKSHGHLVDTGPIPPITQIMWYDFLNPFQYVNAEEILTDSIFVTSLNPQVESFRIALEPVPNPQFDDNCNQSLEFEYTKNADKGQDFTMTATIIEIIETLDDDTGFEVAGTEEIIRHQKVFKNFTDTTKIRQKWLSIQPEEQKIFDFNNVQVQFDITGLNGDPRTMTMWDVIFYIPTGLKAC